MTHRHTVSVNGFKNNRQHCVVVVIIKWEL